MSSLGKTTNRLTQVDYIETIFHISVYIREDLTPLYLLETRVSSFQLEAWSRWSRLFSNGRRDTILDIDKSCPPFFNTRVILPFRAPRTGESSLFQRSQERQAISDGRRFLIGRTFPAARVLSRASTLNLINRRGSWPSAPALITVQSYAYMAAALGARARKTRRWACHLLEPLV